MSSRRRAFRCAWSGPGISIASSMICRSRSGESPFLRAIPPVSRFASPNDRCAQSSRMTAGQSGSFDGTYSRFPGRFVWQIQIQEHSTRSDDLQDLNCAHSAVQFYHHRGLICQRAQMLVQPSVVADEQNCPALGVQGLESVKTVDRKLIGTSSRFLKSCFHKRERANSGVTPLRQPHRRMSAPGSARDGHSSSICRHDGSSGNESVFPDF